VGVSVTESVPTHVQDVGQNQRSSSLKTDPNLSHGSMSSESQSKPTSKSSETMEKGKTEKKKKVRGVIQTHIMFGRS
jgi:hypothetical protein